MDLGPKGPFGRDRFWLNPPMIRYGHFNYTSKENAAQKTGFMDLKWYHQVNVVGSMALM